MTMFKVRWKNEYVVVVVAVVVVVGSIHGHPNTPPATQNVSQKSSGGQKKGSCTGDKL